MCEEKNLTVAWIVQDVTGWKRTAFGSAPTLLAFQHRFQTLIKAALKMNLFLDWKVSLRRLVGGTLRNSKV